MIDMRETLEAEVARFRAWANNLPVSDRSGEWECLYADWEGIYSAFGALVTATTCSEWDQGLTEVLVYIVARDNETQRLIKMVAEHPENLVCLGERAFTSPERDAKSQIATQLGRLGRLTPQIDAILVQYARDSDEYVRRCSLTALADLGSSRVEEFTAAAWETGDEYQRMVVLYALAKIGSPQLDTYLTGADADGRPHLTALAATIRQDKQ